MPVKNIFYAILEQVTFCISSLSYLTAVLFYLIISHFSQTDNGKGDSVTM